MQPMRSLLWIAILVAATPLPAQADVIRVPTRPVDFDEELPLPPPPPEKESEIGRKRPTSS